MAHQILHYGDLIVHHIGTENVIGISSIYLCYVMFTEIRHWAYGKIPCTATVVLVVSYLTGYSCILDVQWRWPVHCAVIALWCYIMCTSLFALLNVYVIHTGDVRLLSRVQQKLGIPISDNIYHWVIAQNTIDAYNAHGGAVYNVAGVGTQ